MILFITGHIGQKTYTSLILGRQQAMAAKIIIPAYRNNNRHIVLVPSGFKGFELPDHSVLITDTSRFWAAPQN